MKQKISCLTNCVLEWVNILGYGESGAASREWRAIGAPTSDELLPEVATHGSIRKFERISRCGLYTNISFNSIRCSIEGKNRDN